MRVPRTPIILALALALLLATVAGASAQTPDPQVKPDGRLQVVHGLVTAKTASAFDVKTPANAIKTVSVDAKTRFQLIGRKDVSFLDLQPGDKITALGRAENGIFTARLVMIEARRPTVRWTAGTVIDVTPSRLAVKNLRGKTITFTLDDKTRILPKHTEIKAGDKVLVLGVQPWGQKEILAKLVVVRKGVPPAKT